MDQLELLSENKTITHLELSTALIEDVQTTHITSASSEIKGLFGETESPLFVSLAEDQQLYLLSFDRTKGWSHTAILDRLKLKGEIETFDAQQQTPSTFRLAFVLRQNGKRHLHWISNLQEDLSGFDSANIVLENEAHFIRFNANAQTPDLLLMENHQKNEFCRRYTLSGTTLVPSELEIPRDLSKDSVLGVSFGYIRGHQAAFFAYDLNGISEVVGLWGEDHKTNFSVRNDSELEKINCIGTTDNVFSSHGSEKTHLFLGGKNGLYFCENASTINGIHPISKTVSNVVEMLASQNKTKTIVWAKTASNELYFVEGLNNEKGDIDWQPAVLFDENVLKLAATSGTNKNKNQLFVLSTDFQLKNIWQDPTTSLWQEDTLHVKEDLGFLKKAAFMTTMKWSGQDGTPLIPNFLHPEDSPKFLVKSSSDAYVEINGQPYALTGGVEVEVGTDSAGQITVVSEASDLYSPLIYVTAEFLEKQLEIHPNATTIRDLTKAFSELTKATVTQNGEKVVPDHFNQKDLEGLKEVVHPITSRIEQGLPQQYSAVNILEKQAFYSAQPNAEISRQDIGNALRYLGSIAENTFESIAGGVIKFAGDVFLEVKSKAGDVVEMIIKVSGQVYSFLVESFLSAIKAFSHLLSIIKAGIKKILDWLGTIFNWENIQKTAHVIECVLENGLVYMENTLCTNQAYKETVLAVIRKQQEQTDLKIIDSNEGSQEMSVLESKEPGIFESISGEKLNWVLYLLKHRIGDVLEDLIPTGLFDEITNLADDLMREMGVKRLLDTLDFSESEWEQIKDQFVQIKDQIISFDLDIQWLIALFQKIASKAMHLAEELIEFILQSLSKIVGLVKKVFQLRLDLPFLNGIFELMGTSAPKIITVASFAVAVPANLMSQTLEQKLPFEGVEHVFEDKRLFDDLIHWSQIETMVSTEDPAHLLSQHQLPSQIAPDQNISELITTYNKYAPKVATILSLLAKGTAGQAKQTNLSFPIGSLTGPMKMGATLLSLTIPTGDDALWMTPKFVGQICIKLTTEPVTDVLPSLASPLTSVVLTTIGNVLILVTDTAMAYKKEHDSDFLKWAEVGFEAADSLGSILVDSGSIINNIAEDTAPYSGFPAVLLALGTPMGQAGYVLRFAANVGTTVCKQID